MRGETNMIVGIICIIMAMEIIGFGIPLLLPSITGYTNDVIKMHLFEYGYLLTISLAIVGVNKLFDL